jgi:hypothetical protein
VSDPQDDAATGSFEHDEAVAGGGDSAGLGRLGPRHRKCGPELKPGFDRRHA